MEELGSQRESLAEILLPLTKIDFTINNTLDFVSRLKNLSVKNDEKIVSFDVSSLFSNVQSRLGVLVSSQNENIPVEDTVCI